MFILSCFKDVCMNASHSHKRVHKEMRRKILPTKNVEERNTKVSQCTYIPQGTYRGRLEIGGMYLPSQLERIPSTTLYVMVDIMKAGWRAPPHPQAGLISPS